MTDFEGETPIGEQLINQLDTLRTELNRFAEKLESSGVERTRGLRETMGRDCSFYRKSLDLFLRNDYTALRKLCASTHELFERIEGSRANG